MKIQTSHKKKKITVKMAARPPYPGTPPPPGAPPVAPQRYGAPQGGQGTPMRYPQQSYPVSDELKCCNSVDNSVFIKAVERPLPACCAFVCLFI